MDSWNLDWLAEQPSSGSSSPILKEPLLSEDGETKDVQEIKDKKKQEIEDLLKKYEKVSETVKSIELPANMSFSIESRSRSISPGVVNHFKKREIKSRNYRRTDLITRKSTSPVDQQKKSDRRSFTDHKRTSIYPKNWTEYKEQRLTIPKDEELKSKCFARTNHTDVELFNKLYSFVAPSTLLESFTYSSEQQTKTVPFSFLRSTRSKPTILYSINYEKIKESYLSRLQLFQIIPKKREELIQSLIDKQSKLQPVSRNNPNRSWYNKAWKTPGSQVNKVIENSVGLSFLQNYSDDEDDNETDDIIICSSVKKNDKNKTEAAANNETDDIIKFSSVKKNEENKPEAVENNSEVHDQTPPQPFEYRQEVENISEQKKNTFTGEENLSERNENAFKEEERSEDISEERLTPERIAVPVEVFETNDVSLTPDRFELDHTKHPLYETRMAINKIEKELEKIHLELIEDPKEQSRSMIKKKKKRKYKKYEDSPLEDGESSNTKKKKKKRNKKSYIEDESPDSESEKRKKSKKEKKKEKSTKKKRKSAKDESNKIKNKSGVSEEKEKISKNKKKSNNTEPEIKLSSGDSNKKNKKKLKKEKRRQYSENELVSNEAVPKKKVSNEDKSMEDLFDPKIRKNRHINIRPTQDLRNLLQQLEKRKEVKKNKDNSHTEDIIKTRKKGKIPGKVEQKLKYKKKKYIDDSYTKEDTTLMENMLINDKVKTEIGEKGTHIKRSIDRHSSRESSKKRKHSIDRLYPEKPIVDNIDSNAIKIRKNRDWEDYEEHDKKRPKKRKRASPNILEDFPLEKDTYMGANKLKSGTPDTDEYRGNWESDDETASKPVEKPNTSWESDEEVLEMNRLADKQRDYSDIFDLEIPLNFKPFTRREPNVIQFKLEIPEKESEFHSPEPTWEVEVQNDKIEDAVIENEQIESEPEPLREVEENIDKIDDAVIDIEQIQSEKVTDTIIQINDEGGEEILIKQSLSHDEALNETKKSRWDKKNIEEPKSADPSFITVVPDEKSPVETSKVLENEYEEFMKAVSTTVGSTSNTCMLNDSVISLSSDSNCSIETPLSNRKLFDAGLGNASTPIKIDLSVDIDPSEVVIAPKDIPFIPMPDEVNFTSKDVSFIPIPGEVELAQDNIPFIPMPGEIKPVPLPNIIPESSTSSLLNLSLLADIAPVLVSQTDSLLKTELPLASFNLMPPSLVMPLPVAVQESESFVSSTFDDTNMHIPAEVCQTPVTGNETPGKDTETPIEGSETPVRDGETLVRGGDTPVRGGDMSVRGGDTPVTGGETPLRGIETPVKGSGTPVIGTVTSLIASETPMSCNDDNASIHTPPISIERPFSLVLPLKKTLVNSRLNFGDSDDEIDKSKKTLDEIKMENLVALAEIEKSEEKESVESQANISKDELGDIKLDAKKKERTRSRSPKPKQRTERRSSDKQSSSKSKKRDASPRRRGVSPRKREKSPRRRVLSPRRRDSSPKKRVHSPKRSSPPRRRSSPGRRRYSSRKSSSPGHRRRTPSPRKKSPKRSSPPRSSSKSAKRARSKSPKRTDSSTKSRESIEKTSDKKKSKSSTVSEGLKKSVADSTIPDESLLPPTNTEDVQQPNKLVDYSKEQLSSISTTYDNFSYEQKPIPQSILQSINHFVQTPMAEMARNSTSKFVQVGNMVQIVPTDLHMKTDYMRTDSYTRPKDVGKEQKMQIVQVGNMLQIVPTELPPLPTLPPLPPEKPKSESLEALECKLEQEKQSAEMSMKQKVAERRAERDKRRLERESRRKEKERRRREKEKDRQVKLKQRTENMIKRALELEVEGGDESLLLNDTPTQWPPLPALAGCSKEGRGILFRGQRSKKSLKLDRKKKVQFADGIRPGEGTSPSAGEELSSPPLCKTLPKEKRYTKTKLRKNKKRKVKVKIIKSAEMENSDEEDNLPPPSPPPGSPPPHLYPSRIKPQAAVVSNMLPQYVPNMTVMQQPVPNITVMQPPVQNPSIYRPPPMNVMGHPGTQLHRTHLPPAPPQRHQSVHPAETIAHHHGIPPLHIAPPPPPPPLPPTSKPGTPLGPTHRNIPYHYQM